MSKRENTSLTSGLFWTSAENVTSRLANFVITIVLARLLEPEQYGTIALVTILISFLDIIVISGMGSSLIQKKDADELDFSSVTWFSILVAFLLYIVVFFSSSLVASFFNNSELDIIFKVMGLRIFLSAFNSVQNAYVSKHMMFKLFFIATLISTAVSGAIGITMAYNGYGVWALVAQYLSAAVLNTILIRVMIPLRIAFKCSFDRIKGLFSYGWKLLLSSLLDTFYDEIVGLSIGKKYSAADLSFYDKGKQLPNAVSVIINNSMSKAIFPAMSRIQDEKDKVRKMAKNNIQITSMILSPFLILLIISAKPLVITLFTEKWVEAAFYVQILSVYFLLKPISTVNLNITKSLGYSDIILKNNLFRKIAGIMIILMMVMFFDSPKYVVIGVLITGIFDVVINMLPNDKLIGYGIRKQLKDATPFFVLSALVGIPLFFLQFVISNNAMCLISQTLCVTMLYFGLLYGTHNKIFWDVLLIIKSLRK